MDVFPVGIKPGFECVNDVADTWDGRLFQLFTDHTVQILPLVCGA